MGKGFNLPNLNSITEAEDKNENSKDEPTKKKAMSLPTLPQDSKESEQIAPELPDINDNTSDNELPDIDSSLPDDLNDNNEDSSDASDILSQDLDIDDEPSVDSQQDDELEDLTDADFDNDDELPEETESDDNQSFAEMAFGNQNDVAQVKGIVDNFQKTDDELMFVMKKSLKKPGVFYLRKKITNGNMDALLSQAVKGATLEIQYNKKDMESTADGKPIYTITDVIDLDLDDADAVTNTTPPEPQEDKQKEDDKEPVEKPKRRKYPRNNKKKPTTGVLKKLITWNNKIGDKLYGLLSIIFGIFKHIPFINKIPIKKFGFWKFICRLWLAIIVVLIGFIAIKHTASSPNNSYALSSGQVSINLSNPQYDKKQATITATVKNDSSVYAYYYVDATIYKNGIIPFTKKSITCSSPTIGQSIGATQKLTFKCKTPALSKISSFKFDIHSDNK